MVNSLCKELVMRKNELKEENIITLYFGGGTPTLLPTELVEKILCTAFSQYKISPIAEITIEGNPDDFCNEKIKELKKLNFNRLSIGIQSFYDADLRYMNRAHGAEESTNSILLAQEIGFENITIDLIYGVPTCSHKTWEQNLSKAFELNIPHISAYALTVEQKTPLEYYIRKGRTRNVNELHQSEQFDILVQKTNENNFIQYEISNFGKQNYFSKHNTNYWRGTKYMGIGPSAHSFDGEQRSYNVCNNFKYIQSIEKNQLPHTVEKLDKKDKFNEYIMLSLRTIWGIDKNHIIINFGDLYYSTLNENIQKYISRGLVYENEKKFVLTHKGKFLCDGIASDLFIDG